MLEKLVLLLPILLLILDLSVVHNADSISNSVDNSVSNDAANSNSDSVKQRKSKNKKYSRIKMHYSNNKKIIGNNNYGLTLPAISFDYTEYFISAVVEKRSGSNELSVMMFLFGHQIIDNSYDNSNSVGSSVGNRHTNPILALNTDESMIYTWQQASKYWDPYRNYSSTNSGYHCNLMNNERGNSKPYQSTAYWITHNSHSHSRSHSYSDSGTNYNYLGTDFAMLKCKLRVHTNSLTTALLQSEKRIFIDIIRSKEKKPKSKSSHKNSVLSKNITINELAQSGRLLRGSATITTTNSTNYSNNRSNSNRESNYRNGHSIVDSQTNSIDGKVSSHMDPSAVVISFSIPWKSRQIGYPSSAAEHSDDNSYQTISYNIPATQYISWDYNSSQGNLHNPDKLFERTGISTVTNTITSNRAHLCVPGIRPVRSGRAEIGIPMLLELIEHYLSIGIEHIHLGLQLDW